MAIQNDNTFLSKGDLKAYHEKILPYLGGNIAISTNNSDYYSTDEKVIGVWIDGKPLYQKTIIDTMPNNVTSGTMANKKIDVSSLNIDKFANWFGMMKTSTGWCMLPHVDGSCNVTDGLNYNDSDSTLWLRNGNSFYNGATAYVTIQYTKTTDTASSALTTPGAYDINFPNTWPENTEIYFGNGLYGYRATGIANVTANVRWDLVIARNQPNAKIRSQGGGFTTAGEWFCPTPWHFENSDKTIQCTTSMFVGVIEGTKNVNYYIMSSSQGHLSYDAWVTYTK